MGLFEKLILGDKKKQEEQQPKQRPEKPKEEQLTEILNKDRIDGRDKKRKFLSRLDKEIVQMANQIHSIMGNLSFMRLSAEPQKELIDKYHKIADIIIPKMKERMYQFSAIVENFEFAPEEERMDKIEVERWQAALETIRELVKFAEEHAKRINNEVAVRALIEIGVPRAEAESARTGETIKK